MDASARTRGTGLSILFDRRPATGAACAALLLLAGGCASTRWPSGSSRELVEAPELIARRAKIRSEAGGAELSMAWIGARTPPGLARIERASFVVYRDDDGDERPGPGEVLVARETLEHAEKVVFHDLRVAAQPGLRARFSLRLGAMLREFDFACARD
ncbi:MAG: hypothetical protein ACK57N_13190 [Planctomycetia bacterium]